MTSQIVSHSFSDSNRQRAADRNDNILGLKSISHPFRPLPKVVEFDFLDLEANPYPVASSESAAWYSSGVNEIHCSLLLPDVTWLGTEFGIKRLDKRTKTVQHFCSLDGLPFNRITVLKSREQELYCCAEQIIAKQKLQRRDITDPHRSTIAFCRFQPESGRWQKLAEESRNYPKHIKFRHPTRISSDSYSRNFGYMYTERQYITTNSNYACLVMGPGIPGKNIALLSPTKFGKVEKILCPAFAEESFHIAFAHADEDSLWIGSDLGLLRYDFKSKLWRRLLPDVAVTGGCPANDGGLWLLTDRIDPARQDMDGRKVQTDHWQITHFVPGKNLEQYPIASYEDHERYSSNNISFSNIVKSGNIVWTTEDHFVEGRHAGWSYYPAVYSLNLETRKLIQETPFTYSGDGGYYKIPDEVLRGARTGMDYPMPLWMPDRFPGWRCPHDEKNQVMLEMPSQFSRFKRLADDNAWGTYSESGSDAHGSYSRHVLSHLGTNREDLEKFIFPAFAFAIHEPVYSPVIIGDKVYFLSQTETMRLYSWDRKTNELAAVPEMDEALSKYRPDWGEHYQLKSLGYWLWVGTGWAALRFNLYSKQVDVWVGEKSRTNSWAYPFPLLSVDGEKAWMKGTPNSLFTVGGFSSLEQISIDIPHFPAEIDQAREFASLIALEDGIVWFQSITSAIPRKKVIIGYKKDARIWTAPFPTSFALDSAADIALSVKQGSIRWFSCNSSIIGYNTDTEKWVTLPPLPKKEWSTTSRILISVDEHSALLIGDSKLFHLDRRQNVWSSEALPFTISQFQPSQCQRDGDTIFVPTDVGLWTYNLTTKQSYQTSAIHTYGSVNNYVVVAVDHNAVWIVGSRRGEGFLIRFDRKSHEWKTIPSPQDMLLSQGGGNQYTADGISCWLNTYKGVYRLDLKTNQWENFSERIVGKHGKIAFKQIVSNGGDVWLVTSTTGPNFSVLPHSPAVPLYLYNLKTDSISPIQPTPGKPLLVNSLTISSNNIQIAGKQGTFLLNRLSNEWKTLIPPSLPSGFPVLEAQALNEDDQSYWFLDRYNALQWKK